MVWPDGPQLQGIAAIIVALSGIGYFSVRNVKKRRAGVPASEDEIESNLIDDKKALQKDNDRLQGLLTEAHELLRERAEAAENRRLGEVRLYQRKIDELLQRIREGQEVSARNRRRFIEKYGESALSGFLEAPELDETWTPAELREFRKLADEANS